MKRTLRIGIIAILLISFLNIVLLAQTNSVDDQGRQNDPHDNPRANACYTGEAWAGQCDTQLEWNCGWYLIRVQYGLFSNVADMCISLLTSIPQTQAAISSIFLPIGTSCEEGCPMTVATETSVFPTISGTVTPTRTPPGPTLTASPYPTSIPTLVPTQSPCTDSCL